MRATCCYTYLSHSNEQRICVGESWMFPYQPTPTLTQACMHTHTHFPTHTNTNARARAQTHTHTNAHAHTHVCIHASTHIRTYTYTHIHAHTLISRVTYEEWRIQMQDITHVYVRHASTMCVTLCIRMSSVARSHMILSLICSYIYACTYIQIWVCVRV